MADREGLLDSIAAALSNVGLSVQQASLLEAEALLQREHLRNTVVVEF